MIIEMLKRVQGWFLGERPSPSDAPRRRATADLYKPDAGVPSNGGRGEAGTAGPSRSLEELRADLARLRASSKERHAPVPVERSLSFDESVFADFQAPATPHRGVSDDYPKTVLAVRPKPAPGRFEPPRDGDAQSTGIRSPQPDRAAARRRVDD
ncbi:hypothetical protein QTH87_21075 [Variovorax sp. J22P168]|uniref:hypothetical protein n=1 Tax=Variovorax jilinensis TaxID=3053513 RepID=UPI0025774C0B|nr:hypothetical protein [Variovorax sp. J22P168]MDM0014951.1 hypothetical protein [Variovorax sp. J22P168]